MPRGRDHLLDMMNLQKQVSVVGADGDEIRSGLGIVISREAGRAPMMDLRIVFHHPQDNTGARQGARQAVGGAASSAPTPSSPRSTAGSRSRATGSLADGLSRRLR